MKNKMPEDSISRKKSFFVALYSCVGVVLILAAIITYINIYHVEPNEDPSTNINEQLGDTLAGNTTPNPEIVPSDEELISRAQAEAARRAVEAQQEAAESIARAKATAAPMPTIKPTEAAPPTPTAEIEQEKAAENNKALADPVFRSFQDGDTMDWPVLGEIVMDYSVSSLVYDKTLDQYRVNDSLWIAAKPGAPVKASCEGVVQKIEKTRRDGTTVTIDNGNGWTTTYGQLLDSVIVKEGEIVKRGQMIGGVANPTIYGVLHGSHVSFKVAKDEATVDPKSVLQEISVAASIDQ